MRRALLVLLAASAALVALAPPANAHGVEGVSATNYLTRMEGVSPEVDGITVRVVETGSRFEVRNETGTELIVTGYQEEPYLRIGRNGVFQNRRSPATYLNASRDATQSIPGSADPKAEPDWEKISDEPVARWHDHRVHWMGDQDPPAVRRAPDRRHTVIPEWTVAMRHGDQLIEARGDLVWIPGPNPAVWFGLAAAAAVVPIALVLLRWSWVALAPIVAALVIGDALHLIGTNLARAGSLGVQLAGIFGGGISSIVAWGVGTLAVFLLAKRRPDGLFAASFAGLFIAVFGGLVDVSGLSRSQIIFAWNLDLARTLTAVSLGGGLGVLVASGITLARERGSFALAAADEE